MLMLTAVVVVEDHLVGKVVDQEVEDREVVEAAVLAVTTAVVVAIANTRLTTITMTSHLTLVGKDHLLTSLDTEDPDLPTLIATLKACTRLPALAATTASFTTVTSINATTTNMCIEFSKLYCILTK